MAGRVLRAILPGFVATGLVTVIIALAYVSAGALGSSDPQAHALLRWMWGLANNPVTEETQTTFPIVVMLHFAAGLAGAVIYALVVEPRLKGPALRRGILFSLVLWVLSLVAFLPAVGGGLLGLGLGAGPLPIVGNLILHLIYGATLGQLYGPAGDHFQTESGEGNVAERSVLARVERTMALGVIAGLVLGGAAGLLSNVLFGLGGGIAVATLLGAIAGSVAGSFLGSFLSLSSES